MKVSSGKSMFLVHRPNISSFVDDLFTSHLNHNDTSKKRNSADGDLLSENWAVA